MLGYECELLFILAVAIIAMFIAMFIYAMIIVIQGDRDVPDSY
jgi:hypothetical protein